MKRNIIIAVILVLVAGLIVWKHDSPSKSQPPAKQQASANVNTSKPVTAAPKPNPCAANTDGSKLIVINTAQRHLWACQAGISQYDSAVITGYDQKVDNITPAGTYHIYAKTTNTTLTGSDSKGSWSDPVYYWMPFLDNQYGTYGFHDATWRKASDFGGISPSSIDASHGCVELPLATAKWLYDWAPVGTTLKVD